MGLYANAIAQVVTQLLSHWIIYLHRNACAVEAHQDRESALVDAAGRARRPASTNMAILRIESGEELQLDGDASARAYCICTRM